MQNMDYYQISAEELGKNSKIPILKLSDSGEVFYELALEMKETIEKNNQAGRHTVFICPVGPIGQYPIFVRLVNRDRVSLKNCWFINMDEYLNDDETYISEDSPLSFRGFMKRSVYEKIDPELVMPQEQRIFRALAASMYALAGSASTDIWHSTRRRTNFPRRNSQNSRQEC